MSQNSPMNQGNVLHNSMNHSNQNINHQVPLNQGSYSTGQGQGQGQGQNNPMNPDNQTGNILNCYYPTDPPVDFNLNLTPPRILPISTTTTSPPPSPSLNPSIPINQRDTTSQTNEQTNTENQNADQEDMSNLVNQPDNQMETLQTVPSLDNSSIQ